MRTAQVLENLIAVKEKSAAEARERATENAAVVIENIPSTLEVVEHDQLSPKERRRKAHAAADAVIEMQERKFRKNLVR